MHSVGSRQPARSEARCQALSYDIRHGLNGDHGVDACTGTRSCHEQPAHACEPAAVLAIVAKAALCIDMYL